jgi:hypothetical protein
MIYVIHVLVYNKITENNQNKKKKLIYMDYEKVDKVLPFEK